MVELLYLLFLFCRERQERMQELKTQKTEFQSGMWNVNSILMGGLGKDPELEGHFAVNLPL